MRAADPTVQTRRAAFGNAVRARRRALGWSQFELAERAGCDPQSIHRVEAARNSPSLDRVFLLADALGCPAWVLLVDGHAEAQKETQT